MSKKMMTPIMLAFKYLEDLIQEYQERIDGAIDLGHELLADHYKIAKAETAMHLTHLQSILPTERSWAEEVYKEGQNNSSFINEEGAKPFADFYSQYESEKEGGDTNNNTDNK